MTTDALPAVALLFDDPALVRQVREALDAAGASIVHEGALSALTADVLATFHADVLVINLDEHALDALDRAYALFGTERPRIVFNDAEASATLAGWDRARWARHLAAKVLAAGGVDPPRPPDALAVDVGAQPSPAPEGAAPPAVDIMPGLADATDDAEAALTQQGREEAAALSAELEALLASEEAATADDGAEPAQADAADGASDEPAATGLAGPVSLEDLDALTAVPDAPAAPEPWADAPPAAEDAPAAPDADALVADAAPPEAIGTAAADAAGAVDVVHFADAPDAPDVDDTADLADAGLDALLRGMPDTPDAGPGNEETPMGTVDNAGEAPDANPARGLDELLSAEHAPHADEAELPPAGGLSTLELVAPGAYPRDGVQKPARAMDALLHALPPDLAVVKDDAPGSAPPPSPSPDIKLPEVPAEWALLGDDEITPATFGVEKVSAEDFLAPEASLAEQADEPVMNLELVSMEEAVAPRPVHASVEMHLDELHMALSRLVLTGCTLGGTASAEAFYAALPADTPLAFVHTQHLRGKDAMEVVRQFAGSTQLKVSLAAADSTIARGQVLVVPAGQEIRVHRDGRVELKPMADEQGEPSIDASFRMAADGFGRDALAIVFSGHGTDSVEGATAVHRVGGQVWVETTPAEYADMVNEIAAAGAVDYAASPAVLAARLLETVA